MRNYKRLTLLLLLFSATLVLASITGRIGQLAVKFLF